MASADASAILRSFQAAAAIPGVGSYNADKNSNSGGNNNKSSRPGTADSTSSTLTGAAYAESKGIVVSMLFRREPPLPLLTPTVLQEKEHRILSSRAQVVSNSARSAATATTTISAGGRIGSSSSSAVPAIFSAASKSHVENERLLQQMLQQEAAAAAMASGRHRTIDDPVFAPHPVVVLPRFPETQYERNSDRTRQRISATSLAGDRDGLRELARAVAEDTTARPPPEQSYSAVGSRYFDADVATKKNVVGAPLRFDRPEAQSVSPRASGRVQAHAEARYVSAIVNARTREEKAISAIPPVGHSKFAANMSALINTFVSCAKGNTQLTFPEAALSLALLDVTEASVVQSFCGMMDVHQDKTIDIDVLASVLDTLVNGPVTARKVRDACFAPFNLEHHGYVHLSHLMELRSVAGPDANADKQHITPAMVKQLLGAFHQLRKDDEDEYVLRVIKRGKKRRKVPPLPPLANSFMPSTMKRREHMTYEQFCAFFDTNPGFAVSFAPLWLRLVLHDPTLQKAGVMRSVAVVTCQEALAKDPPPPIPPPPPKKKKRQPSPKSSRTTVGSSSRR